LTSLKFFVKLYESLKFFIFTTKGGTKVYNVAIFDLNNISDLDKDIVSELKSHKQNKEDSQIISLFKIKDNLNVDEVIVGLARRYNLKKTRS